ncbi:beta-N-acetylglucosaminidase domain-containing protein [Mycoplasma sp. 4423]
MKIRKFKKLFPFLGLSSLFFVSASYTQNHTSHVSYNIDPEVKEINYLYKNYVLNNQINLVVEDGISNGAIDLLQNSFKTKNFQVSLRKQIEVGKTNILIGNSGNSDKLVDNMIANDIDFNNDIQFKNDAYLLTSRDNIITAFGFKQGSEFYAAATFTQIFNQLQNRTIESFIIKDYSDYKDRGIIEAAENNNWSNNERFKYLDYAQKHKLNMYFYGNYYDQYLNSDWKQLYDDKQLNEFLIPFVNKSLKSNIQPVFIFNIFKNNKMTSESLSSDFENFKAKIQQLIANKITKFGFIINNSSEINLNIYQEFFSRFNNWYQGLQIDNKDIYILLDNLNIIDNFANNVANSAADVTNFFANIPNDFKIITTTKDSYDKDFIDNLANLINNKNIILWNNSLNSTSAQNNFDLSGFTTNIDKYKNIKGILLNPSLFFENAQIPLYMLSNYLWNANNADFKQLYNTALDDIIGNKLENKELIKLFKDFVTNIFIKDWSDNTDIENKLKNLQSLLSSQKYNIEDVLDIQNYFNSLNDNLKKLANYYFQNSFITTFSPWINAFIDLNNALINALNALINLKTNSDNQFANNLFLARKNLIKANTKHQINVNQTTINPQISPKILQPFINYLLSTLDDIQNQKLHFHQTTINDVQQTFITSRTDTPNTGAGNIFDPQNKDQMLFTNPNRINKNDYFGVEFSKPLTLNSIYIQMKDGRDHFFYSKLQYRSINGIWTDVNNQIYQRFHDNIEPIQLNNLNIKNVSAVRVIATQNNPEEAWLGITNFLVNQEQLDANKNNHNDYTEDTADESSDLWKREGSIDSIKDDDFNTNWAFSAHSNTSAFLQNQSVAFMLPEKRLITRIDLIQGQPNGRDRLSNFKIEYYDDASHSWKLFSSKNDYGNSFNIQAHGYAITNKFRFVNNTTVNNSWWRITRLRVGYDDLNQKQVLTPGFEGTRILGRENVISSNQNNSIGFITDKTEFTSAVLANATNNGYINVNQGFKVDFKYPSKVASISILQNPNNKLSNVKVQGILNGETVNILDNVFLNDDLTKINLPINTGILTGIKVLSTQNTQSFWEIKSFDVEFNGDNTNKYLYTSLKNSNNITTSEYNGTFRLFSLDTQSQNHNYQLNKGDYIGIDLKKNYQIANIDLYWSENKDISLLTSVNGIDWTEYNPNTAARYIILFNNSDKIATTAFNHMVIYTQNQEPFGRLIDTNISNNSTDTFKTNAAFDSDFNSVVKISKNLRRRDFLTYDLGSNINLHSIKIFSDLNNINWLRNADIQVSNDNINWTTIYSTPTYDTKFTFNKLSDTDYGFYDAKYPNYRYWGVDKLNINARYIKIFINDNYPENHGLNFNEIVINDGKNILNNKIEGFSGTNIDSQKDYGVLNLLDQNLDTFYKPISENGSLTYDFSYDTYTNKNLEIFALTPANAQVSATIYDEQNKTKNTVILGNLLAYSNGFILPTNEHHKIISIKISWSNLIPQISQIVFVDKPDTPINVDKSKLEKLLAAKDVNYPKWTNVDMQAYDEIFAKAQLANASEYLNQDTINYMILKLNNIISNAHTKVDLSQLSTLISNKVDNSQHQYTNLSYEQYLTIYNKILDIINSKTDISINAANDLINLYNQAKDNLKNSIYNQENVRLDLREFQNLNTNIYTQKSLNELRDVVDKINQQLSKNTSEEEYKELNNTFIDKYQQLKYNQNGNSIQTYQNSIKNKFIDILKNQWPNWMQLSKDLNNEFIVKDAIITDPNTSQTAWDININFLNNLFNKFTLDKSNQIHSLQQKLFINPNYKYIFSNDVIKQMDALSKDTENKIKNNTLKYDDIEKILKQLDVYKSKIDKDGINKLVEEITFSDEKKLYYDIVKTKNSSEQLLGIIDAIKMSINTDNKMMNNLDTLINKVNDSNKKSEFLNKKANIHTELQWNNLLNDVNSQIIKEKPNNFLDIGLPIILALIITPTILFTYYFGYRYFSKKNNSKSRKSTS